MAFTKTNSAVIQPKKVLKYTEIDKPSEQFIASEVFQDSLDIQLDISVTEIETFGAQI